MALLKSIQSQNKMSIVLISHDLNLVQHWADRTLVLNKGVCEEMGTTKQLFQRPQSPYTKGLINAIPPVDKRPKRLRTVQDFITGNAKPRNETITERKKRHKRIYKQSPVLEVKGLEKTFRQGKQPHHALHEINFSIYSGETLGLVGNSGSGKSTLGSCLLKLIQPDRGEIYYSGTKIDTLKGGSSKAVSQRCTTDFSRPVFFIKSQAKGRENPYRTHASAQYWSQQSRAN